MTRSAKRTLSTLAVVGLLLGPAGLAQGQEDTGDTDDSWGEQTDGQGASPEADAEVEAGSFEADGEDSEPLDDGAEEMATPEDGSVSADTAERPVDRGAERDASEFAAFAALALSVLALAIAIAAFVRAGGAGGSPRGGDRGRPRGEGTPRADAKPAGGEGRNSAGSVDESLSGGGAPAGGTQSKTPGSPPPFRNPRTAGGGNAPPAGARFDQAAAWGPEATSQRDPLPPALGGSRQPPRVHPRRDRPATHKHGAAPKQERPRRPDPTATTDRTSSSRDARSPAGFRPLYESPGHESRTPGPQVVPAPPPPTPPPPAPRMAREGGRVHAPSPPSPIESTSPSLAPTPAPTPTDEFDDERIDTGELRDLTALFDQLPHGQIGVLLMELRQEAPALAPQFVSDDVRSEFLEHVSDLVNSRLQRFVGAAEGGDVFNRWVLPDLVPTLDALAQFHSLAEEEFRSGASVGTALTDSLRTHLYDRLGPQCAAEGWFQIQVIAPFEEDFDPQRHHALDGRDVEGATGKVVSVRRIGRLHASTGRVEFKAQVVVGR